jgi:hypothetical protein
MAKKAFLLLPLTYNDGSAIPLEVLGGIRDDLYKAFHGWTVEGVVEGAYRMQTGEKRVENLLRISVVLEPDDLPTLRKMVAGYCSLLGQELMYLEISDSIVEFIPPLAQGE